MSTQAEREGEGGLSEARRRAFEKAADRDDRAGKVARAYLRVFGGEGP